MICMVRELVVSSPRNPPIRTPILQTPLLSAAKSIHRPAASGSPRHAEPPPSRPESEPPRFPRDPNHLSLHGTQIIVATCPSIIRGLNHSSACETLAPAELVAPKGLISERGFAPTALPLPLHVTVTTDRARSNGLRVISFSFGGSASRAFAKMKGWKMHGRAKRCDIPKIYSFTLAEKSVGA